MSYILDALKRAEEERGDERLVNAAAAAVSSGPRPRFSWRWALLAVLVVNGAALGYAALGGRLASWPDGSAPPAPAEPPAGARTVSDAPATPAASTARVVPAESSRPAAMPDPVAPSGTAATPDPVAPPARAAARVSPAAPVPPVTTGPGRAERVRQPADRERSGEPADRGRPAMSAPPPRPGPAAAAREPAPVAPPGERPAPGAPLPAPRPAPSERPAPAAAPVTPPPPADGAAVLREAIGQLRLQALVYSPRADERMVFINGRKYVEGQQIDGRVLVERIREEGVLLSYQGHRLLLTE